MENKTEESLALPDCEDKSLEAFKQTILNGSELGDSFSTISPDLSHVCSEYDNDQFEDIFYRTSKDESCITVNFVSIAFFYAFQDKLISDFSSSIEYDETKNIYKCTTHLRNLKCHIKLDGNSRSVVVSGVGRIHWRKNDFPRVARIIFKQYVQKSESQFGGSMIDSSQCEVLSAEKVGGDNGQSTSKVQLVFSSTPLISKTENQTENCVNTVQQPVFNSTPIVPRKISQTTGRRLDTQQTEAPVMNTGTTNTETTQQTEAPVMNTGTTNTETTQQTEAPVMNTGTTNTETSQHTELRTRILRTRELLCRNKHVMKVKVYRYRFRLSLGTGRPLTSRSYSCRCIIRQVRASTRVLMSVMGFQLHSHSTFLLSVKQTVMETK